MSRIQPEVSPRWWGIRCIRPEFETPSERYWPVSCPRDNDRFRKGSSSNQSRSFLRCTTSPTTMMEGGFKPSRSAIPQCPPGCLSRFRCACKCPSESRNRVWVKAVHSFCDPGEISHAQSETRGSGGRGQPCPRRLSTFLWWDLLAGDNARWRRNPWVGVFRHRPHRYGRVTPRTPKRRHLHHSGLSPRRRR